MPLFKIIKSYHAFDVVEVESPTKSDALAFAARKSKDALCYSCSKHVELVESTSLPLPRVISIDGKSQSREERYSYDEQMRRDRASACECDCHEPPFEDL